MKSPFASKKIVVSGSVAALLLVLQAFSPVWAQSAQKLPAEADKVHLVLLVAGADAKIGGPCLNDVKAMEVVLKTAFAKESKRLVVHNLTAKNPKTGKLYTGKEVLDYLKRMNVGTNENVLVFHSGHGGIADAKNPEKTHHLYIDGGEVDRWAIQQLVLAKKPRSLIVLTDCCSAWEGRGPQSASDGGRSPNTVGPNLQTVRSLVLKPVGVVSITAADDGKLAIAGYSGANPGKAGSAFTVAMLRLWYRNDVTYTSWSQFFPTLRTETGKASNGQHMARAFQLPH